MEILTGQALVNALRKLSDNVKERLWIAVPYIGGKVSIDKILGNNWHDDSIEVKLLTDINSLGIDSETLNLFLRKGNVKSLNGLHAKIYIIDDKCILATANLTNTAFAKRYEIGILCNSFQSLRITIVFEEWWTKAELVTQVNLDAFKNKPNSQTDENGYFLPELYNLPPLPKSKIENVSLKDEIKYWRIGTSAGSDGEDFWPEMLKNKRISIGWPQIGNLKAVSDVDKNSLMLLLEKVGWTFNGHKSTVSRKAGEIFNFYKNIKIGDIVLPSKGHKIIAIGKVKDDYNFVKKSGFPHIHVVDWLKTNLSIDQYEGPITTVYEIKNRVTITKINKLIT